MTNPMQPLDPISPPDPVTPADSPSSPSGFAMVTPHGRGPAPYDIQAPQQDLAGMAAAAGAITGAGIVYGHGPRQAQTERLLTGLEEQDIDAGYASGWPANTEPGG